MLDRNIVKQSLIFSVSAVLYVGVVTRIMSIATRIFPGPDGESAVAPIVFLLLLVVSAATMGLLIFGKPVMLYMDGKKREAVTMVVCTIGSLAVITALLIVTAAVLRA